MDVLQTERLRDQQEQLSQLQQARLYTLPPLYSRGIAWTVSLKNSLPEWVFEKVYLILSVSMLWESYSFLARPIPPYYRSITIRMHV